MSEAEPSLDLQILLERLSFARSNWERAQLLFQSWRKVKALSPDERDQLAMQTGIDGADVLIQRLVEHKTGKKAPPELSAAIRSLEKEDPKKFARLFESLQNPDTFQNRQVISDAVSRIGNRMIEDAVLSSAPPDFGPGAPSPFVGAPAFLPPAAPLPAPLAPSRPAPAVAPAPPPAPAAPAAPAPPAPAAPAPTPAAPAPVPAAPAASTPAPPRPAPPAAAPAASASALAASAPGRLLGAMLGRPGAPRAATPDGWARLQQRDEAEPEAELEADAGASAAASLAQRLRREPRLIHRFRIFHTMVDLLVLAGEDACDEAVASFPQGWARGRALGQLLQAGAYPTPERAEAAVARIESAATRRALSLRLASR